MTLGERIRAIRKEKNLTLKTIAEETELSIAFLSQLETNKCSATMASLRSIADALNVHPSLLFEYETLEERAASIVENGFEYTNLSHEVKANFTPQKVLIEPHNSMDETVTHPGHEFVYCLKGSLTLVVGEQQYQITTGQSYMYDAMQPHYWYNHTEEEVEFLVVNNNK